MNSLQSQPLTQAQRRRAMVSAVASVRAEGLEPSAATLRRLEQYANGQMMADELQQATLAEVATNGQPNRS